MPDALDWSDAYEWAHCADNDPDGSLREKLDEVAAHYATCFKDCTTRPADADIHALCLGDRIQRVTADHDVLEVTLGYSVRCCYDEYTLRFPLRYLSVHGEAILRQDAAQCAQQEAEATRQQAAQALANDHALYLQLKARFEPAQEASDA